MGIFTVSLHMHVLLKMAVLKDDSYLGQTIESK